LAATPYYNQKQKSSHSFSLRPRYPLWFNLFSERILAKWLALALFVLLVMVGTVKGQEAGSTIMHETFDSETLGRLYQYNVYLPANYDVQIERRYPVIYLLHGRSADMGSWLTIRSALDRMIAEHEIPPIIAVMPDMPSSQRASYYVDSQYMGADNPAEAVETAFFSDLIPHIDATYRTVTARAGRLIGGYSMGGYGAIRYALAHADTFAGALVLSPAVYIPQPPSDSSTREFGAFGKGEQPFDEDIYTSLNYPVLADEAERHGSSLAVFIAVGDDEYHNPKPEDWFHDLDVEAHLLYNRLVRIPTIAAEFRVYDGGHDWDVWARGFEEGIKFLTRYIDAGG
jgi:enterochelin esterase-like enzyme